MDIKRQVIDQAKRQSIFSKESSSIFIRKDFPTMNISPLSTILPSSVFSELPSVISTFKVDSPLRLGHFLGQCAHESGNWRLTEENLNYSKEALMAVFRRHFPTEALASQYARKPERIANRAYGSRMGNGGPETGDGWKFRGRGYIQLTGRNNYTLFNNSVQEDIINTPDLVATKYPLFSAGWFWDTNNLNPLADIGGTPEAVTQVTRRINGGTNGLTDRLNKFNYYYRFLR